MKGIGFIINYVVMVFYVGQMVENMKVNFRIIICMAKELILGQMVENIMVNISMIKNMYILTI